MKKVLRTSVTVLAFGGALGGAVAQNSFPDVSSDSYAADAVSQLVELGIVNGFPDGTFRGNEAFTRYQAALVVSRLLSVIDENNAAAGALSEEDLATVNNAIAELQTQLGSLSDRVAALEQAPGSSEALGALTDRVTAIENAAPEGNLADSLTAIEGRVAALEQAPAPATPGPDITALQEQVTALNQQVNTLQDQLSTAGMQPTGAETPTPAPEEPDVAVGAPIAAPEAVSTSGSRGKFYVGLGSFYEINAVDDLRFRPRFNIGVDNAIAGFGLRGTVDYGRQSLIDSGAVTTSGYLTYTLGASAVSAYLGAGGGYQFSDLLFDDSGTTDSTFAGALLGAEFGSGPLTFFLEGTADYYFDDIAVEGYEENIYPTVAVGINFRP